MNIHSPSGSKHFNISELGSLLARSKPSQNADSEATPGNLGNPDKTLATPEMQQQPDVLSHALEYIINGEFQNAQDLLEEAIIQQPSRLELHLELLELYQSMHNFTGFNRMFYKLIHLGVAIPKEWTSLSNYFQGFTPKE